MPTALATLASNNTEILFCARGTRLLSEESQPPAACKNHPSTCKRRRIEAAAAAAAVAARLACVDGWFLQAAGCCDSSDNGACPRTRNRISVVLLARVTRAVGKMV